MMNYVDHKDELVYNVKKLYHNLDLMSDAYPNLSKWIMYKMSAGYFGFDADVTQGALSKLLEHQQKKGYFKDCSKEESIKKQIKKQPKDEKKEVSYCTYKYEIKVNCEIDGKKTEKIFRADTMNSFWNIFKSFLQNCIAKELDLESKKVKKEDYKLDENIGVWLYHFADNFTSVYKNPENIAILDKFEQFAKLTHTIGNFLIVPADCAPKPENAPKPNNSFNVLRGGNDINDYFDLTLKDIKKYYDDTKPDNPEVETLLIKNYNKYWLEIYGSFENFIDCNSLNMYVNEPYDKDENGNHKYPYTLKPLFGDLERGNIKTPKTEQQHRKDINEFLDNVIANINKRNNEIELALKAKCRFE